MNGRGGALRTLRWLIVAVVLVWGVVLVTRGHLLVGSLLCGLGVLRVAYLLVLTRRRSAGGRRWDTDPGRALLRGLRPRAVTLAATTIGIEPAQLRREFAGGRSIAEIASAAGVAPERVANAVIADATAMLDKALANGTAPAPAVSQAKTRLPVWTSRLIHATRDDLPGPMRTPSARPR
jgi:hypothetical protein